MIIKAQFSLVLAFLLSAMLVQAKTATEVFEKVSPSIVVIKTYDAKGKDKMLGSGVIMKDGVVVTNCHVLKEAATILVLHQNTKYSTTLLHSDWNRDVCSLAVDGLKGPAVTKGCTTSLKVGEKVYAIGAPKGLELTLSDGLISSLRQVEVGQYIQITAPISPGSSGGGLFDDEGRLIGLPTFFLTEGQQLNFAVPVEWINELPKRNAPAPKGDMTTSAEWFNKAIAFQEKKDWMGMLNHSLSWTKAQPGEVDAWFCLGIAYDHSDQTAMAIEAYRQATRINSKYWGAWYNLGRSCSQSQQTNEAIDAFREAIHINPDVDVAWMSLGLVYAKSNQFLKAIESYQQSIRINPEAAMTWTLLGVAYAQSKQTSKAIESYEQALRIKPEDADTWYFLGIVYKHSGQARETMAVYKRLKALNPTKADDFFNNFILP